MSFARKEARLRGLKTTWISMGALNPARPEIFFMIHGFPDNADVWEYQLEYLSRQNLCIAIDLRGVSGSEEAADYKRYSCESLILDFFEVLAKHDPGGKLPVHVIGHDIGATIAWEFTRALSSRAQSLVIFNGPSFEQMKYRMKSPIRWLKTSYIDFFMIPNLPEKLLQSQLKPVLLKILKKMGHAKSNDEGLPEGFANTVDLYRALYREAWRKLFQTKRTPLETPTLVLWGKNDLVLPVPKSKEFTGSAKNVELRVLNLGHWLQQEDPEHVNKILVDFYQRVKHAKSA